VFGEYDLATQTPADLRVGRDSCKIRKKAVKYLI